MPQGGLTFVHVQHVLSQLKKPTAAITCSALSVAHTFAGTACRACRSAQRPNVTQFDNINKFGGSNNKNTKLKHH